ncbi:hypothetical protein Tco_1501618 [Tanacetum coccineum]
MAQTLIKMKEEKAKEKGVSIKDVDDSLRPARSILTLKPLPIIDPKDKDAEIARLIHEKKLAEMDREREERQRHDQAYVDYIASLYDEVHAKMDASEELAARLQMEDREMYTIEERDEKIIDKMNKKAAGTDEEDVLKESESTKVKVKQEGREENIRKRSGRRLKMKATKKSKRQKTDSDLEEEEQLRASLKIVPDEEEEIDYEVLGTRYPIVNWESAFYHTDRYGVPHDYYRVFRANGSSRYIKTFTEMVSRFDRLDFIELHNDDIWKNQEKWIIKSWTFYENYGVHILALEDGTEIHMLAERRYPLIRETLERMMELRLTIESEGRRLKMKATKKSKKQKTDSDLEKEEQLRASLKIVHDEKEEIDYEVLGTRVFRANGSLRYIKTFTEMVSRFDRLDFIELHSLVMQRFSTTTPEGIDLVLWGDLRIMFEETADDDIWKNQEKWIIKSWTFYENCRVHILALEDGTEIHMLVERRYPLIRETLERMMELRLTAESEGEAVFDLLRFIQKQIDEFGGQDGSEKDL